MSYELQIKVRTRLVKSIDNQPCSVQWFLPDSLLSSIINDIRVRKYESNGSLNYLNMTMVIYFRPCIVRGCLTRLVTEPNYDLLTYISRSINRFTESLNNLSTPHSIQFTRILFYYCITD